MDSSNHQHEHVPHSLGAIPTPVRLNADSQYTGKGVTLAFLDSGFYPHPDLLAPANRIIAFHDLADEQRSLTEEKIESWHWHGTQTSVTAAGNGHLSDGVYRGLAHESGVVLVKVSERGRISEENIARGIRWVIANRERYNIRVLNISLGGDQDVPCSQSIIDQAAEEAISHGIAVVAAAGNEGERHSIPPANAPSVITVGGYSDNNHLNQNELALYHSNFGFTADGTVKPELIAPAMWIAAPILPGTDAYERAGATHYQHVDGTSFAAPIVTSVVAQMIQANPGLTPATIKNILISTADRIASEPVIRQGYGVVNARRAVALAQTEKHALNLVGYKPPRVANGRLLFVFHDDAAETVSLAGSFNGWNPNATPLKRDLAGLWSTEITAPRAGRFEYKFVINGQRWIEDPSNGMKAPDHLGGLNSLLLID